MEALASSPVDRERKTRRWPVAEGPLRGALTDAQLRPHEGRLGGRGPLVEELMRIHAGLELQHHPRRRDGLGDGHKEPAGGQIAHEGAQGRVGEGVAGVGRGEQDVVTQPVLLRGHPRTMRGVCPVSPPP